MGCIYILTNPSFKDYIKIGYADNVEERLKELNRSDCIPYAFRIYATYEVQGRLKDINLHNMLDTVNANLRSIDEFDGKRRVREFYAMSAEDAYKFLKNMAIIHGTEDRLKLYEKNAHEIQDGTLCIIDLESNEEVENNATPSKKAIVGQAIVDLGGTTEKEDTLYQRYHSLMKLVLGEK